jgi:hypothetical protein
MYLRTDFAGRIPYNARPPAFLIMSVETSDGSPAFRYEFPVWKLTLLDSSR